MGAAQGSFLGSLECIGLTFFKKGNNSYSYVNISSPSYPRASLVAQRMSLLATEDCWSFNVEEMVGSQVQFEKITTKGFAMRGQRGETERSVKNPPAIQEAEGSIAQSGRSPGKGNGYPLQYSCLENSMDRGAWWATVHGVTKSRTQLSDWTTASPKQEHIFLRTGYCWRQRNEVNEAVMGQEILQFQYESNNYLQNVKKKIFLFICPITSDIPTKKKEGKK